MREESVFCRAGGSARGILTTAWFIGSAQLSSRKVAAPRWIDLAVREYSG